MAATQPKEALSLADLNILAANPPPYPEKPYEENQEPLVLYISRVPGTRDIILSPFKPSLKNVGPQDVSSSLYYVHHELPISTLVAPTQFQNAENGSTSDRSVSAMTIPRKPLPDSARPLTPESASSSKVNLAAPVVDGRQRGASVTSHDGFRPALSSSLATESYMPTSDADGFGHAPPVAPGLQAPPVRKPVGPRAMVVPAMSVPDSAPTAPTGRRLRSDSNASALGEGSDTRHGYASRTPSPRKNSVASVASGEPFALTLIRRDPGTGNQWNVGRVTSRQLDPPAQEEEQGAGVFKTSSPPDGVSTSSPPIRIDIENSGYAKFRPLPRRRSLEAAGLGTLAANSTDDEHPVPEIGVFCRQLQMGYTKSLMSNLKDKIQKQIAKKGHNRSDSDSSREMANEQVAAAFGQPGPGMKPRGYTFTSPWNGKCDFRTGTTGRSVRCYHTPHDPQNRTYNQLLEEQGINLPRPAATALSELRFNLPSTDLYGPSDNHPDGANGESKLRGHFAKLMPSSGRDADEDYDNNDSYVSPFELNIGGERAGGGKRGNRAKLGKLVIYHDGLKMLDLLVAANIGVWWGAWERSF